MFIFKTLSSYLNFIPNIKKSNTQMQYKRRGKGKDDKHRLLKKPFGLKTPQCEGTIHQKEKKEVT